MGNAGVAELADAQDLNPVVEIQYRFDSGRRHYRDSSKERSC